MINSQNLLGKKNLLLFLFTLGMIMSHGVLKAQKAKVTTYKKGTKIQSVTPPQKWMKSPAQDIPAPKKEETERVKVTYVYDTLPDGRKEFVVGYIDKKTNVFREDTTLSYRDPAKIAVAPKPQPKPQQPKAPEHRETIYPPSKGIHISHSVVPDQNVSNYLSDYINNYNRNYGKRLRNLKVSKRSTFAVIENILKRHSLPLQMKYLAVIESSLNPRAVSPVGAVGCWQFMAPTARDMNLVVNEKVDQRTDLYKSTDAASRYMKHLYRIFGDWLLVIASYNSGPGPVMSAIRKTGTKNFWYIKNRLPSETRGHVMAFLATAAIMERLDNFSGLYKFQPTTRLDLPVVEDDSPKEDLNRVFGKNEKSHLIILNIDQPLSKDVICKRLAIEPKDFDRWNPEFDQRVSVKGAKYSMYIPRQKMEGYSNMKFKIKEESIAHREAQKNHPKTIAEEVTANQQKSNRVDNTTNYIVQYGETIDMIADRFGVTVEQLLSLNKIKDYEVFPGDIIRVK